MGCSVVVVLEELLVVREKEEISYTHSKSPLKIYIKAKSANLLYKRLFSVVNVKGKEVRKGLSKLARVAMVQDKRLSCVKWDQ